MIITHYRFTSGPVRNQSALSDYCYPIPFYHLEFNCCYVCLWV